MHRKMGAFVSVLWRLLVPLCIFLSKTSLWFIIAPCGSMVSIGAVVLMISGLYSSNHINKYHLGC